MVSFIGINFIEDYKKITYKEPFDIYNKEFKSVYSLYRNYKE